MLFWLFADANEVVDMDEVASERLDQVVRRSSSVPCFDPPQLEFAAVVADSGVVVVVAVVDGVVIIVGVSVLPVVFADLFVDLSTRDLVDLLLLLLLPTAATSGIT